MRVLSLLAAVAAATPALAAPPPALKILFVGDDGHHRPADRHRQLVNAWKGRNIDLVYAGGAEAFDPKTLAGYDGVMVYANIDDISKDQAKALLDFVAAGKGFVPVHCASYCFRNDDAVVALIGAQFKSHGTGTFRVEQTPAAAEHPVTKGFASFESWDETYVHAKHNEKDRTVLELRDKEPWTWVRTPGKGRVFYTAWGHDARTWAHPGFQNLLERGLRWACGQDPAVAGAYADIPKMAGPDKDAKQPDTVEAKIAFYPARGSGEKAPTRMPLPLPAADSVKHAVRPANLDVKLFADETLLGGKPICLNWDDKGRLWVAITRDYPNELQPEGKGRDKIIIVEDTNGDGVGDKVTTFAENLSIPTSMTFAFGGVVVHQAPHTLFLKDTDGDGKADLRTVLWTGWGTRDTHAGPSNLRVRAGRLVLRHRRLFRLRRHHRRREVQVQPGVVPLQTRSRPEGRGQGDQVRVPARHHEQLVGRRLQRGRPPVRLDGQRLRQCLPADPEPLLRAGARLVVERVAEHPGRQRNAPRHRQGAPSRLARRVHRRRRPRPVHGPNLPAGILEQDGVRVRADRPPRGDARAAADRHRLHRPLRLEPARLARRMDLAGRGRGRAGRLRVGDRLVRLHRPAQPDAPRLRHRQGGCLRNPAARREARPDLPARAEGRQVAGQAGTRHGRAVRRRPEERQHALAAARRTSVARSQQEGRRR